MRLITLILIGLLSAPFQAFAKVPVTVAVTKKSTQPVLVTTRTLKQIRAIAKGRFSRVTGLTKSKFNINLQAKFTLQGNGRTWCVKKMRAEVAIGYKPVTVYVPREFPNGTCAYNAVYAHELAHVRINDDVLQRLYPKVRPMMSDAVDRYGTTFCASTQKGAQDKAMRALKNGMRDVTNQVGRIARKLQGRIDTKMEYDRVSRSCREWPSLK